MKRREQVTKNHIYKILKYHTDCDLRSMVYRELDTTIADITLPIIYSIEFQLYNLFNFR